MSMRLITQQHMLQGETMSGALKEDVVDVLLA